VFVAAVTFRVVIGLPSPVLLIAGGLCFGALGGTLFGALGILLSGIGLFVIARRAGRERVLRRAPARLRRVLDLGGSRLGTGFAFVTTAYPIGPLSAFHLLAGASSMALRAFVAAVAVGAAARAGLYAFFGNSLLSGEVEAVLLAASGIGVAMVTPLAFKGPRTWIRDLVAGRYGAGGPP
jgi:uncharacterized membrane protein YdjX (TVP38/TMEM64 family)